MEPYRSASARRVGREHAWSISTPVAMCGLALMASAVAIVIYGFSATSNDGSLHCTRADGEVRCAISDEPGAFVVSDVDRGWSDKWLLLSGPTSARAFEVTDPGEASAKIGELLEATDEHNDAAAVVLRIQTHTPDAKLHWLAVGVALLGTLALALSLRRASASFDRASRILEVRSRTTLGRAETCSIDVDDVMYVHDEHNGATIEVRNGERVRIAFPGARVAELIEVPLEREAFHSRARER